MRKLRRFFSGRLVWFILFMLLFWGSAVRIALVLPRALAPLAAAERLFSCLTAVLLFFSDEPEEMRELKLTLVLFLPFSGAAIALVYFPKKRVRAPAPRFAPDDLFMRCANASGGTVGEGGAEYLPTGREFEKRLLADLANAKKRIYLEYYIVAPGAFWGRIEEALARKAEAGVEICVLYDDFGCALTLPRSFPKRLARRKIACAVSRPLAFPFRKAARRNHRKLAVIDGEIAYVGGINLADEYTGDKIRFGHWKDTALRLSGRIAEACEASFLQSRYKAERKKGPLPPSAAETAGNCLFVTDTGTDTRNGARLFETLIGGAKKSLLLTTPYLAPDTAINSLLKSRAQAGIEVKILIPRLPDKKSVFRITRAYARELIGAGAQVREYTAGFLHAKSVCADGELSFVGSYNLDFRSLYFQAECAALVKDEALAEALTRDFETLWKSASPVPEAKRGERAAGALLKLLAPLV